MSTNRNIANLSITIVKTLVKMAGFGPVADMIDGSQECLNLLADIKNDALGNPNAKMIRTLKGAINSELNTIQDTLQQDGLSRKQIKNAVAQLSDTAGQTIKSLREDDDALIRAVQQPEHFIEHLKSHAVPLPDDSSASMQAHYEKLLEQIAQEFLTLAPCSANFEHVALTSLLRCFSTLEARVEHAEQKIHEAIMQSEKRLHEHMDKQTEYIVEAVTNSRQNTFTTRRFDTGTRPAPLSHSLPRHPKSGDDTLQKIIFESSVTGQPTRNVLIGRPGCGKTQIAASIANECDTDDWSMIAWFDASSRSKIEQQYITFGESALGISRDASESAEQSVGKILATLKRITKDKTLFVFDNVETINDIMGLLPTDLGVNIIVTTRKSSGWDSQEGWNLFRIDNFTRHESVDYLTKVTNDNDKKSATKLAAYLGDLPLAIAQAAAMAKRYFDSSISDYYTYLQSHYDEDLEELLEPIEGDGYTQGAIHALRNAKQTTLSKITSITVREEAIKILDSLCYLDETGVPKNWIKRNSDFNRSRAYQALIDSSLIEESDGAQFTHIHRLLARSMRSRSTRSTSVTNAIETLEYALKTQLQNQSIELRMQNLRHLSTQLRAICQYLINTEDNFPLTIDTIIIDTLRYAYDFGMFDCATSLYATIHQLTFLQNKESAWLTILDLLGINLCALRKFDDAHSVYEILFSSIDDTHFLYHIYRGHLARLLYFEEKDEQALEICKNTLESTDASDPYYGIYEYTFAKMIIDTTFPFDGGNQAHIHNANTAIRYAHLAIHHTTESLHQFEPRHRINAWMTMAAAYSALDLHTEAIHYSRKALNASLHQLEDTHPDVYTYKFNLLAYSKRAFGLTQAIVDELTSLVSDLEAQYTTFSPEAFTMHYILAKWLFEAKRYQEAIAEVDLCITASESQSETTDPPLDSLYTLRNMATSQLAELYN